MGMDRQFYSDGNEYLRKFPVLEDKTAHLSFPTEQSGKYLLQYGAVGCRILEITGCQTYTAMQLYGKRSVVGVISEGRKLDITFTVEAEGEAYVEARLLDSTGCPVPYDIDLGRASYQRIHTDLTPPGLSGFTPAIDKTNAIGRFGFTKGDGLLDYSMPYFGIISRPFISGNPKYRKDNMWHLSLLPKGEEPSGNINFAYDVPENETIEADWTHVRWERRLDRGYIAYDYSILTPSLLIESDLCELRLSMPGGMGMYRTATLTLHSGTVMRNARNGVFYDKTRDGELQAGYILLTRSGEFPEVPLMLALARSPERIVTRDNEITVEFDAPLGWAMVGFPYGIELFEPHELTTQWHMAAVERCTAYHSLILSRPTACSEYFRISGSSLTVRDVYSFRAFADAWNTPARTAAPIPPVVMLTAGEVEGTLADSRACDQHIPTKYGPLYGVNGSCYSDYTLPIPSYRYDFTFDPKDAAAYGDELHEDFREFVDFYRHSSYVQNPGNFSFLFQYAVISKLIFRLKPEDRALLTEMMEDGLKKVCDPDYAYTGPEGRPCVSWYQRTEPFSKLSYYTTYLHVSGIRNFQSCEREIIERTPIPFIEIDWGNAMSLYSAWLGALQTGRWDEIEQSWDVFRHAFDYYLVYMDWACMTSGYAENGITWNDGTNYGGYLGFLNMAEMLGKHADFELGLYAYAKMTAMRCGLFIYADRYAHKYFGVEPWYGAKFFHDETDCSRAFISYPSERVRNHYRQTSLYNMVTEGHYREAWRMYADSLEKDVDRMLTLLEGSLTVRSEDAADEPVQYHTTQPGVLGCQEVFSYLELCMLTDRFPDDRIEQMILDAKKNGRLSEEILGSPLSHRRIPRAWTKLMLLSDLRGKGKAHITAWKGIRIVKAAYPQITVEGSGWIEVRSTGEEIYLDGAKADTCAGADGCVRINITDGGCISFAKTR